MLVSIDPAMLVYFATPEMGAVFYSWQHEMYAKYQHTHVVVLLLSASTSEFVWHNIWYASHFCQQLRI